MLQLVVLITGFCSLNLMGADISRFYREYKRTAGLHERRITAIHFQIMVTGLVYSISSP